jgi:hypothetical protein
MEEGILGWVSGGGLIVFSLGLIGVSVYDIVKRGIRKHA